MQQNLFFINLGIFNDSVNDSGYTMLYDGMISE
jgi:hypothetical protein